MAGTTAHYGYTKLTAGDALSQDNYAFTDGDRDSMDYKDYMGTEGHHHTGVHTVVADPATGPVVTLTTNGFLPAGTTVRYRYTWVDGNGAETAASPETSIATPNPIATPGGATLTNGTAGSGTLAAGNYFYVLSAYVDLNTQETAVGPRTFLTVPQGTTGSITVNFPFLPIGATGFNIYRRTPGATQYLFLESIDCSGATPPTSYTDNGGTAGDCNRVAPYRNTTNSSYGAVVSLGGATPVTPAGLTWKVYRTYHSGDYSNSFVHWVVEQTSEGSGIITPTFTDLGAASTAGSPPVQSQVVGSPDKVLLTGAAEVQGTLPLSNVSGIPMVMTFHYPGPLSVTQGSFVYPIEVPSATILGVRASTGFSTGPASQPIIVDVNKGHKSATPSLTSIFADVQANMPQITVGNFDSGRVVPTTTALVYEDFLTVDIDQVGGGATPTDRDLTVSIYLMASGF